MIFHLPIFVFAFVALFFVVGHAHSDLKFRAGSVNCSDHPPVISYHIHIVFMLTSNGQIQRASDLRDQALKEFSQFFGKESACKGTPQEPSGRYDDGQLCLIYDHKLDEALKGAPFPVGEWSIFVPVHYYHRTVSWFAQNRGEFSLLVHPNTGCEYEDHSIWAFWAGEKWILDMTPFIQLTQTNEFEQEQGTVLNPVCGLEESVCGSLGASSPSPYQLVPQVSCCSGLRCECDKALCGCRK